MEGQGQWWKQSFDVFLSVSRTRARQLPPAPDLAQGDAEVGGGGMQSACAMETAAALRHSATQIKEQQACFPTPP